VEHYIIVLQTKYDEEQQNNNKPHIEIELESDEEEQVIYKSYSLVCSFILQLCLVIYKSYSLVWR